MRGLISIFIFLPLFLFSWAQAALASGGVPMCPPGNFSNLCNVKLEQGKFVGTIVGILLVITVVVCLVFIVMGGIKWSSSSGDQQKVAQARSTVIAAVVGLIIAFLAYFIVAVVAKVFAGVDIMGMQLPKLVP